MIASPSAKQEYTEPEDVTYMRLLAGEDEYRACVLYLGGSYEITTDVQQVLDSQTDLRELWGFVYDIPQDHWVVAPDGGCDLYCIFPQEAQATLSVYETSLTDDAENRSSAVNSSITVRTVSPSCCCATSAISSPTPRWSCTPAPAKSWYSAPSFPARTAMWCRQTACATLPSTRKGTTGRPIPAPGR